MATRTFEVMIIREVEVWDGEVGMDEDIHDFAINRATSGGGNYRSITECAEEINLP